MNKQQVMAGFAFIYPKYHHSCAAVFGRKAQGEFAECIEWV
jgi:hypothetical protein